MSRKIASSQDADRSAPHPQPTTLWRAIDVAALARGHSASDIARFVGLHAAHFYRLRKAPALIAKCHPDVLARFAAYIGWTVLDVYAGAGLVDLRELWTSPSTAEVLRNTLKAVSVSRYASGIVTPMSEASADHQVLIARLHAGAVLGALG